MESKVSRDVVFKVSDEMLKKIGREAVRRNQKIADMIRQFVTEKLEETAA